MIDITAALIIMMIIPVMWSVGMQEKLIMKYAESCGADFVEDVCHQGAISERRFEAFVNSLSAPCGGFEIEMECESPVSEPLYQNGIFSGKVSNHVILCGTDEILKELYASGECRFVSGTRFSLAISKNDRIVYVSGTVTGNK